MSYGDTDVGSFACTMPDRAVLEYLSRGDPDLAPVPDVEADSYEGKVWAEFGRVGGGSTAWVNLAASVEIAADETLDGSGAATVDWAVAWNQYHTAQGQLSEADRALSYAYDLGELERCQWCETQDADHNLVQYGPVGETAGYAHKACLAEALRELGL